jgi:hypothetical protein
MSPLSHRGAKTVKYFASAIYTQSDLATAPSADI